MEYEIINSSSKGNCTIIDKKIMIDCGVAYSKIKEKIGNVKVICLTHIHSQTTFTNLQLRKLQENTQQ